MFVFQRSPRACKDSETKKMPSIQSSFPSSFCWLPLTFTILRRVDFVQDALSLLTHPPQMPSASKIKQVCSFAPGINVLIWLFLTIESFDGRSYAAYIWITHDNSKLPKSSHVAPRQVAHVVSIVYLQGQFHELSPDPESWEDGIHENNADRQHILILRCRYRYIIKYILEMILASNLL